MSDNKGTEISYLPDQSGAVRDYWVPNWFQKPPYAARKIYRCRWWGVGEGNPCKKEKTQSCLHLNIAWAAYSPLGYEQPFSYYISLNTVPLFRFRKGGFFVSEGHEKFFNFFLKNTLPKPTPYSEYVKGLIPDSVQEPLRDPWKLNIQALGTLVLMIARR